MANYSKSKNKNTVFGGTDAIIVPTGGTADRSGTELGQVRYNTDLGFLEQYNATGWAGIDAPPTVSSITGTINEDTDSTITILGSNFKSGSIISVEGNGVSGVARNLSTTFVNSGELTALTNASSVGYVGGASFTIKVTNPSGLAAVLEPAGTIDRDPAWTTAQGSLGTIYDQERGVKTFQVVANDADGTGVTYQIVSGSIPAGMSFNTSTGDITGTPNAVGGSTTSTFTVRASSGGQDADRQFSITVREPVVQTFNYTGGWQTFNAPSGPSRLRVKLWGAGGAMRFTSTAGYGGGGGFTDVTLSYSGTPSLRVAVGGRGDVGSSGAGGGGSSSIMQTSGSSLNQSNAVAVAGAGGGSHSSSGAEHAGAGGGTNGQGAYDEDGNSRSTAPSRSGGSGTGGGGGSQTQGGQNGVNNAATTNATSGGAFSGGRGTGNSSPTGAGWPDGGGGSSSGGSNGGGGGGGWYGGGGGGGGSPNNGSAGGGSGYVHSGTRGDWTVVSGNMYTGNNNNIPSQGSSDANYPGGNIGQGATANDNPGNHGAVVIIY
jgi:hypothetical protein